MQVSDEIDWQCISCRQGSNCACSWCEQHTPQQPGSIDMEREFHKLCDAVGVPVPQAQYPQPVYGTLPPARTAPPTNLLATPMSPEPQLPSSGAAGPSHRGNRASTPPPAPTPAEPQEPSSDGAGPSHRGPRAPTPPAPTPTPASGGGATADGLDLSKLTPGTTSTFSANNTHQSCTYTGKVPYTGLEAQTMPKMQMLCCLNQTAWAPMFPMSSAVHAVTCLSLSSPWCPCLLVPMMCC